MIWNKLRLLLALMVISLAACNLNTTAPTIIPTDTSAPVQPPGISNDLPAVGYPDIEPSGVAGCVLKNAGTTPVMVYALPAADLTAIAALQPGTGLAGFEYQSDWYHVNFTIGQTEVVGWVSEAETTPLGDCLDIHPPAGCSVQPSVGRVIDIYGQPDRNSQIVNALNERYFLPFIQFNAEGWFNVDTGSGQSGWIAPDEGQLVGACDNGQ